MKNIKQLGFTLIELLVGISILTLLLLVGIPSFQQVHERNRLNSASEAIYSDLQFARSEAVKQGQKVRTSFTINDPDWCYGLSSGVGGADPDTCDCTDNDPVCDLKQVDGADFSDITVAAAFGGNTFTTFEPRRGTASSGTVTIQSGSVGQHQVIVSVLGGVKLQ